jgi:hydrogenase-4 membrane subunit HyfE
MKQTRTFRFLTFTTYLPLPILGIMVIFGLMGKFLNIGWLQSAPDVLMIPMLVLYYISLIMGAIYGYLKQEESVYLMAMIGVAIWIVGFLLGAFLTFTEPVMIGINVIIIGAVLVLHVLQYMHTKKWEARLSRSQHHARHA